LGVLVAWEVAWCRAEEEATFVGSLFHVPEQKFLLDLMEVDDLFFAKIMNIYTSCRSDAYIAVSLMSDRVLIIHSSPNSITSDSYSRTYLPFHSWSYQSLDPGVYAVVQR
jgi:hypothetical protein